MKFLRYSSLIFKMSFLSLFGQENNSVGKEYINMHLGGRLGNQMFQIAAGLSLAEDTGFYIVFPDFLRQFSEDNIQNYKNIFSSLDASTPLMAATSRFEEHPHFHFQPIPLVPNMDVFGYFQSEKYFKHNKEKICAFFEAPSSIKEYLTQKYTFLIEHPNTVAIHMRAYQLEDMNIEKCFPFLTGEYFQKATEFFSEDALFVIFSDNIEWAQKEMSCFTRPHVFIKESPYNDLYLMSFCKHQIISPSSFSWWGAYLNKNPNKKVIAPDPWFSPISGHDSSNVVPENWILFPWQVQN